MFSVTTRFKGSFPLATVRHVLYFYAAPHRVYEYLKKFKDSRFFMINLYDFFQGFFSIRGKFKVLLQFFTRFIFIKP